MHRRATPKRAIAVRSGALDLAPGAAMGCGAPRPLLASGNAPVVAAIQLNGAAHPGAAASTTERRHHFCMPSISLHVVQPLRTALAECSSENMPSGQLLASWRSRQLTGRMKHGSRPTNDFARDLRRYVIAFRVSAPLTAWHDTVPRQRVLSRAAELTQRPHRSRPCACCLVLFWLWVGTAQGCCCEPGSGDTSSRAPRVEICTAVCT